MNIYEDAHQNYFDSTAFIDPTTFLFPLEQRLVPGDHILDIGCGSGRDLKWFRQRGYAGTGLKSAPSLAALAKKYSTCRVIEDDFMTFDFATLQVQAILLVGALIHVERGLLPMVLDRLLMALVSGGHILLTLKQGDGVRSHPDGRKFVLWQDRALRPIFACLGLEVNDFRIQISSLRPEDVWLGYVLKKPDGGA